MEQEVIERALTAVSRGDWAVAGGNFSPVTLRQGGSIVRAKVSINRNSGREDESLRASERNTKRRKQIVRMRQLLERAGGRDGERASRRRERWRDDAVRGVRAIRIEPVRAGLLRHRFLYPQLLSRSLNNVCVRERACV